MDNLISQLQAKGLKKVSGNVIGDESYFRGDTIGDGWTWNELQWYYGAEASALSFNENQAFINVENGAPRTSTDYITVKMGKPLEDAAANAATNVEASGIKRGLSDNEFYVWGNAKNFGARVAVHDPAKMAAKTFKEALEKKGISIGGNFDSRDWHSDEKTDISKLTELAAIESKPLGEIVKKMNKHSVNLYAELILRTMGKKFGAEVPGEIQRPQNVRGDDTSGALLVKKWLNRTSRCDRRITDLRRFGTFAARFRYAGIFRQSIYLRRAKPFRKRLCRFASDCRDRRNARRSDGQSQRKSYCQNRHDYICQFTRRLCFRQNGRNIRFFHHRQ